MDASIFRELALWATAGGGGLVLGFKLIQKFSSGARAAIAADDKSVSLLDRLERQIKEQEERYASAEGRHIATVQRLEERADAATVRADKADRERNEALLQVERLTYTVEALKKDVQKLTETVERYAAQQPHP